MSTETDNRPEKTLRQRLREASSFRRYVKLALAMSVMLVLTLASVGGGGSLATMLAGCGAMLLCGIGAWLRKKAETTNTVLLGCLLWLIGLLTGQETVRTCLQMGGVLLALVGVVRMVPVMREVVLLVVPEGVHGFWRRVLLMVLSVGAAALIAALLLLRAGMTTVLHALNLLAVLATFICTLNMPVDKRYAHKLHRYLNGHQDNEPLRKRLEWVFVQKRRRPWLLLVLVFLIKPFYRYRLKDAQEIHEDEDNPLVYLCNHGELYGPVASFLHIPERVRPWSISYIMADHQEAAEYMHRYTFGEHNRYVPQRLKWPVSNLAAHLSLWAFNNWLESVPVFRDKPRQLMNTFRLSVDVLISGDPLLIFPENPNAVCQDHGYEPKGVGELFSGFAMLAPIYYNRTGKRCRFLPMYAHQGNRTMSFGKEIQFDPENDPTDERNRLVAAIDTEMHRLYDREEAIYQQKKAK